MKFRKFMSILFAVMMVFSLSATVFAAETTATISVNEDRVYEVYQIFTGDLSGKTLSNIKWGKNGTGTEGTAVDEAILEELDGLSSKSDVEKLAVIEKYVDLDSEKFATVSKDFSLTAKTGYYLFKDITELGNGQEASEFIVKLVADITVTAKAEDITVEKKVKDKNDSTGTTTDWQDSADYDIGDSVPFQLKATVSKQYDSYEKYYLCFHDTLSAGLTFNTGSVTVKIDGTVYTNTDNVNVRSDSLTDGCSLEVEIVDLKNIEEVHAGSIITVEYTATLNDRASVGSAGNENKVHLEYSNDPNNSESKGETPDDKVVVFTYQLVINKVDENNAALKGAGFTLYKKIKDDSVTEGYKWEAVGSEIKGTDLTTFTWKGLDDGDYKLVETTTPAGYNTMADIEFTISASHDADSADPKLTTLSGGTLKSNDDVSTGTITKAIENRKGTVLPETGAKGTMIFITIGSIIVIAAAVFMITRKKMSVYMD